MIPEPHPAGSGIRPIDNDHKEKENEMFNPTLQTPCILTCDARHNHGTAVARFTWSREDPIGVKIEVLNASGAPVTLIANGEVCDPLFHVARSVLFTAVRSGKSFGCPVVGEGAVTCKVLTHKVTTLSIRWMAGAIMWVDRDELSRWIDDTYSIVSDSDECATYDVDKAITRILESK